MTAVFCYICPVFRAAVIQWPCRGISDTAEEKCRSAVTFCLPSLSKLQKGIFITDKREKEFTNSYINTLEIKTSGMEQLCMHLSGGNKQKVVIAKWVGFDASVLIMDCPTRGIDIGVKAEIYRIMEKMKADGRTIILISEELPELIGMSDRLLIMKDGKITKEFQRSKELSDRDIINYMI